MAGMAARIARDRRQPFAPRAVAHIVHQRPGAVERGGAQIVGVPGHDVATGMAGAAADAFDAGIGSLPLRAGGGHGLELGRDRAIGGLARLEAAARAGPFVEEGGHVCGQVADDRQVGQRPQFQHAVLRHAADMGPAGPARAAIHGHRAGPAHADAAGEAIGKARLDLALDVGDDVEHRLVGMGGHPEGLQRAVLAPPPDLHRQHACHLASRSLYPRGTG